MDVISERNKAIQLIISTKDFLDKLEKILNQFNVIEDILKFFEKSDVVFQNMKSNNRKFKDIYIIRNALKSIHDLIDICRNSESAFLANISTVNNSFFIIQIKRIKHITLFSFVYRNCQMTSDLVVCTRRLKR